MRDIKFRGWNKQSHIMVNDIQIYAPKNTVSLNEAFDPAMVVQPLQYVGRLDVNDVEIYEGDIIEAVAEDGFSDESVTSDVIWNNTEGSWQLRSRDNPDKFVYMHGLSLGWGGWVSFKVIGNIYENPELLKGLTS